MKIYETSEDIAELARNKFAETYLEQVGINLNIISVTKSKSVLKVSKASAVLRHLTNKDVILTVYEDAFDRLSDEAKAILMEGALSNVSFDTEKDKLNVDSDIAKEIFRMRTKYDNYVDILEASYIVASEIEEEEKKRKAEEKARKEEAKKNKKSRNDYE